ncbi:isoaspartyl peptidase/L-asparaginase [Acuticoccus sp. M5D2P5]|uniref:isoaspartyl peptidase/L-asparaginase family protein n=1 Tax=Acuticoccus kalidii TaxID=2910977 RepID=UPI001F277C50|nr:isoaspartyl peptidase/L-asparaginase [Acuticoccus kalidii]MCF3934692.1 isoaspartyl peptidase/L-asparaginase [Acuticoccus kalidii]
MTAAIAIHGGAGAIERSKLGADGYEATLRSLAEALRAGWSHLAAGASAVDAVEAAVIALEDDPLFNAGRGACFNADGLHEFDAAIMDGRTLSAGAVAACRTVRNPVRAARSVMDHTRHVLLVGEAADAFAAAEGLPQEPQSYFHTDRQWSHLERARARAAGRQSGTATDAERHGTVGAVARDRDGHLAAATSTGGMTNKRPGRVGDTPLIGAGTYARDGICAVSCTGSGEDFIRACASHTVAARIAYGGDTLAAAAHATLHDDIVAHGGGGGLIAVGADGGITMPYSSAGMYRGAIDTAGRMTVAIYDERHEISLSQ